MEPDRLTFEMGLYKAAFPVNLAYSDMHFWFQTQPCATGGLPASAVRVRCGLTAYAARLLTDLFRVEWKVYTGEKIEYGQVLGEVESTKASSELYAPMSGKLTDINSAVIDDPSLISLDPYEAWLLEFEGASADTLAAPAYVAYLAAGWDETVKLLKGLA